MCVAHASKDCKVSHGKRIGGACLWCLTIAMFSLLRTGDLAIIDGSEAHVSVGRCLLFLHSVFQMRFSFFAQCHSAFWILCTIATSASQPCLNGVIDGGTSPSRAQNTISSRFIYVWQNQLRFWQRVLFLWGLVAVAALVTAAVEPKNLLSGRVGVF